jgi:hypothetical protein
MPSEALYCVAIFQLDVSEKVLFPSSGCLRLIGFRSCVTEETLFGAIALEYLTGVLDVRFEVSTAVTMKNGVFWDVMSCGYCFFATCVAC